MKGCEEKITTYFKERARIPYRCRNGYYKKCIQKKAGHFVDFNQWISYGIEFVKEYDAFSILEYESDNKNQMIY